MKLKLLAKVPNLDAQTKEFCGFETRTGVSGQAIRNPKEAIFPYFAAGFVNADIPRDSVYSDDIVKATEGWALADELGNLLGEYKTVKGAESARAGAKLTLAVDVESEKVAV